MSEDNQEQESNEQVEGNVAPEAEETDGLMIGDPGPEDTDTDADGQPNTPEPGNELDTSMQVKDADVPWDVIEAQEKLPDGEIATGYFMFNGNPVLVCTGGIYGKHEGNVQRLPVKVLIDNIR